MEAEDLSRQFEKGLKTIARGKRRVVLTVYEGDGSWGRTKVVNGNELMVSIDNIGSGMQFTVTELDDQGREFRFLPRAGKT